MNTKEFCRRARLTPRQAQVWCEKRILEFQFIQGDRSFEESELQIAAVMRELRRKGVGLPHIRRMPVRELKDDFLLLVVNGGLKDKRVRWRWCAKEDLIRLTAKAPGPCLVVCLEDLRRELEIAPRTASRMTSRRRIEARPQGGG